jgi:hypothetical protein
MLSSPLSSSPVIHPIPMSSHPGRSLIAGAERRFGHLAIPHLVRWIGIFQLTVWALNLFSPDLIEYLVFDRSGILQGQIWRAITFIFIPGTNSPILILFAVFFLWFISDGLENEWGMFRVNLFVLATVGCLILLGMIPVIGDLVNVQISFLLFSTLFFAFAAIYPDQIINLFGVIPVKAKWLAAANAGMLIFQIMSFPLFLIPIAAALLPFLVVFVPGFIRDFKNRSDAATRRGAFQERMKAGASEAFHTCHACGITDVSNPEREFRVAADGEEYCDACLTARDPSRLEK